MDNREKPANGQVVVLPIIPELPSGVYDTGTVARRVCEADLANNPPETEEESGAEGAEEDS